MRIAAPLLHGGSRAELTIRLLRIGGAVSMTTTSVIRHKSALFGLAAALVLAAGCDTEQPTLRTEPAGVPASRAIEDLKKDLKPPVVIKPSITPGPVSPPPETR
jgi:hypothetical protein